MDVGTSGNGCVLRVKPDDAGVSAQCCPESTTFIQNGVITWSSGSIVSPCFAGMFTTEIPDSVNSGLSPGQVFAVILSFCMFIFAIVLMGYSFRRTFLRIWRSVTVIIARFIQRFDGFAFRNARFEVSRFCQRLFRQVSRDQGTTTDFVYYDGRDLVIPDYTELDCGDEFLLALGERIIAERKRLDNSLQQVGNLLTENFVSKSSPDVLAQEFDLACTLSRPLPDIPELDTVPVCGAVGGAPLADDLGSTTTLVLGTMANRIGEGAWSV